MSSRSKLSKLDQEHVRRRANNLCEYCHASEEWQYVRFTIDHIVPQSLGGNDKLENLALACFHCNRRKANKLTGTDPQSELQVRLFNPRLDQWSDHFIWSSNGLLIVGLTALGRTTVEALELNRERVIAIRAADKEIGRHPPLNDRLQSE